ncbi:hypothetical protein M422DRAFT_268922 [Sphaerobolus stellatus SS14]|uniref:Uncharacterized protein n=1 Tax=Sphaerobolus stellatus (strain SS14) TaxID=990650 RepID=A0A0C9TJ82_SPHS4|nr:hypothetical protein M422DRAFT_268922 [Sphaerobolus stellatus SS14]
MSRMSPRMKELFAVPSNQVSGKTLEPGNNRAHDKAAAQAATQHIIAQMAMMDPAPSSGAEEHARTTRSHVPGDQYSRAPFSWNISEDIPHSARSEQGEDSQPRCGCEAHTVYASDTPEVWALDANAQYWSDLTEEKVNNLLHEEAPEEALLEAAQEVSGLMPEQQVQFSANTGRNITSPSRNDGPNPIIEPHIPQTEVNAQFGQQSTPALSINAQLDGAVVAMTSEYSSIQQMVRQALQNASLEDELEKSFLAKAGVKMGNPPTYGSERNLEKFENWIQLQLLGQCLTDEAQEWFYQQVERFDREVKHWDLESVLMGLQKWFIPTLLLNKVAIGYDHLMQGSINVQQLHQQSTKLANKWWSCQMRIHTGDGL